MSVILIISLLGCYNPSANNSDVITYLTRKIVKCNGNKIDDNDFIVEKDFKNNIMITKNKQNEEIFRLEKDKVILMGKDIPFKDDRLARILHKIQLETVGELEDTLKVVGHKEVRRDTTRNFIKVYFKKGYLLYDKTTKTIKEYKSRYSIVKEGKKEDIEIDMKVEYALKKGRQLLSHVKTEAKSKNYFIIMEERVK